MRLGLVDYPDANGAATSSSNSYLGIELSILEWNPCWSAGRGNQFKGP
jgi:hypothetical protein